jgi:hypothetical protein
MASWLTAAQARATCKMVGSSFWLNLRSSLDECRAHGISLAEAKRRLEARLVAEGHGSKKASGG